MIFITHTPQSKNVGAIQKSLPESSLPLVISAAQPWYCKRGIFSSQIPALLPILLHIYLLNIIHRNESMVSKYYPAILTNKQVLKVLIWSWPTLENHIESNHLDLHLHQVCKFWSVPDELWEEKKNYGLMQILIGYEFWMLSDAIGGSCTVCHSDFPTNGPLVRKRGEIPIYSPMRGGWCKFSRKTFEEIEWSIMAIEGVILKAKDKNCHK